MNSRWLSARAVAALLVIAAIAAPATVVAQSAAPAGSPAAAAGDCSEEYVWVGALSTLPLFQARDFPVLYKHAQELGVCARVSGPDTFDVPGELAAIEQECAGNPAGILVLGLDASLTSAIDKCIDQKVPVVTVDVDVPGSKRLSFVGGDFHALGVYLMSKAIEDLTRRGVSGGQIAMTGALTNPSTLTIIEGAKSVLSAPGSAFTLATVEEDSNTAEGGAAAEAAILSAYPDLVASIHFNSECRHRRLDRRSRRPASGQGLRLRWARMTSRSPRRSRQEDRGFFGPRRELPPSLRPPGPVRLQSPDDRGGWARQVGRPADPGLLRCRRDLRRREQFDAWLSAQPAQ